MKRKLQERFIYILAFIFASSVIISCANSDENLHNELMSIYELNTSVKHYDEATQFLEVTAQLDYVDLGYLKVDVHPLDVTTENAWRSSFIFDDFEGDTFHGQFNIPTKTVGEYEVVFYIVDHNNIQSKISTEIYIDKYPIEKIVPEENIDEK
ncbi:hypothetical protein [Flammeovirga sp. SJP92]|uniref:hypothetical protein n=1 Tax=Flammeovirga sp. SJP92 TaxID=1775430 RepID=UPI0007869BD5|nr:hypothetical protein [Flammeovirga sp. SJP92]KXX70965.1 hypothetical protein AVL50_10180 [Flammeovirga sp. SJP92]